jgi:glycosyltransferase involved in cell wall biosynthesis
MAFVSQATGWRSRLPDARLHESPSDLVLSVAIPMYNEEATLREIVRRVGAVPVHKEIILIDDCSRGRSREVMQALPAEFGNGQNRFAPINHSKNRGKGAAV